MNIEINGCTVEESLAQMLTAEDAPELVYSVDELEGVFPTPEEAMAYGDEHADGWIGDMTACEYRNNLRFDEEKWRYALADESQPPLSFTGRYWTRKGGKWTEE